MIKRITYNWVNLVQDIVPLDLSVNHLTEGFFFLFSFFVFLFSFRGLLTDRPRRIRICRWTVNSSRTLLERAGWQRACDCTNPAYLWRLLTTLPSPQKSRKEYNSLCILGLRRIETELGWMSCFPCSYCFCAWPLHLESSKSCCKTRSLWSVLDKDIIHHPCTCSGNWSIKKCKCRDRDRERVPSRKTYDWSSRSPLLSLLSGPFYSHTRYMRSVYQLI